LNRTAHRPITLFSHYFSQLRANEFFSPTICNYFYHNRSILPNQTISHELITHLRILQDELGGLNTAGAYYLTTSLLGLQDYVPPPELFYSDVLKEVYDSPILLESLPIFSVPKLNILPTFLIILNVPTYNI